MFLPWPRHKSTGTWLPTKKKCLDFFLPWCKKNKRMCVFLLSQWWERFREMCKSMINEQESRQRTEKCKCVHPWHYNNKCRYHRFFIKAAQQKIKNLNKYMDFFTQLVRLSPSPFQHTIDPIWLTVLLHPWLEFIQFSVASLTQQETLTKLFSSSVHGVWHNWWPW